MRALLGFESVKRRGTPDNRTCLAIVVVALDNSGVHLEDARAEAMDSMAAQ